MNTIYQYTNLLNKGKRKVQGVPQSQTAAPPRPQEEEETDKSKQAQTEQTFLIKPFLDKACLFSRNMEPLKWF